MENSVSSLITGSISISKEDKDTLLSSLDSLSAQELEVIKQTLILEQKEGASIDQEYSASRHGSYARFIDTLHTIKSWAFSHAEKAENKEDISTLEPFFDDE